MRLTRLYTTKIAGTAMKRIRTVLPEVVAVDVVVLVDVAAAAAELVVVAALTDLETEIAGNPEDVAVEVAAVAAAVVVAASAVLSCARTEERAKAYISDADDRHTILNR